FVRWMRSDSKPQKWPPAMTHNQQAIEQPERDCRHHEQVHRGNPISMVTKERPPSTKDAMPSDVMVWDLRRSRYRRFRQKLSWKETKKELLAVAASENYARKAASQQSGASCG